MTARSNPNPKGPPPWNDWYHVIGHTYGVWRRGDPRSWRSRHHREHVIGDYKHLPPKEMYDRELARSTSLMARDPVFLTKEMRRIVCDEMVRTFHYHAVEIVALAVDDHHFHLLGRFPDHRPRHWVGLAKRRSARVVSDAGLIEPGGMWGKRTQCAPIRDRRHQVEVVRYIARHGERGAVLWLMEGVRGGNEG